MTESKFKVGDEVYLVSLEDDKIICRLRVRMQKTNIKLPEVGQKYQSKKPLTVIDISPMQIWVEGPDGIRGVPKQHFFELFEELPSSPKEEAIPNISSLRDNPPEGVEVKSEVDKAREEQTDSPEDALRDLDYEIKCLQSGDNLKFIPKTIAEDMLQKNLARLMDKGQALIDALDGEKLGAKPNAETLQAMQDSRSGNDLEAFDSLEEAMEKCLRSESIWKPVSELGESYNIQIFFKAKESNFLSFGVKRGNKLFYGVNEDSYQITHADDECLTLTDFINSFKSEQKARIELEERVRRLEGRK